MTLPIDCLRTAHRLPIDRTRGVMVWGPNVQRPTNSIAARRHRRCQVVARIMAAIDAKVASTTKTRPVLGRQ